MMRHVFNRTNLAVSTSIALLTALPMYAAELSPAKKAERAEYLAKKGKMKHWYEKMDVGPVWANVFEDYYQGTQRVAALKGLTLELSQKDSIRGLFDTETLRMSSVFQGDIYMSGTPWTGVHGGINRMANEQNSIMQTSSKPGWADKEGSFDEKREIPGYGNLPEDHGRFKGHYRHGDQIILDYTVLGSRALELPSAGVFGGVPLAFRQLDVAASDHKRVMMVTDITGADILINKAGTTAIVSKQLTAEESASPEPKVNEVTVVADRTTGDWDQLSMGAPSKTDSVDRSVNKKTYFRVVPGFTDADRKAGDEEGVAVRLNDGQSSRHDEDQSRNFFFKGTPFAGRLEMNLGEVQKVNRIHLYSQHSGNRASQNVEIYGATKDTADSTLEEGELEKGGWVKVTAYTTGKLGNSGRHGVAVLAPKGGSIGEFQKLLFISRPGKNKTKTHTYFSEIDIYSSEAPALKGLAYMTANIASYCVDLRGEGLKFTDGGDGQLLLEIPATDKATRFSLGYAAGKPENNKELIQVLEKNTPDARELGSLTEGGAALYPEVIEVEGKIGSNNVTWAVDSIPLPVKNPWYAMVKPGGLDLFEDGDSAAVCTWNGDVWVVTGLNGDWKSLKWRRFATGLYEPLGLKVVDGLIYVNSRSQITRLHDQNNDGEADRYECFNNDVYVTANFHEFTFGLQTDDEGNFYIAKGAPVLAGGRGFDRVLPHNGTLLKISKDGKGIEVMATGLRAPGGLGIGPNGEFTTGENEGTWQPSCKLNYFTSKDKFLGVEDTAQHLKGQEMHLPLCYFPMRVDNSGGSQVWVPKGVNWGLKPGELIHLSYGQSSLYRVLKQEVDGVMQGGVVRIPVKFDSSAMRARYHNDGSLYVTGFRGWQTNAATEQGLNRVRYTGKDVSIPDKLDVTEKGIYIRFEKELDPSTVEDKFNFKVERWKYIRSVQYGSGEFSIDNPDLEAEKQALIQESKKHHKHDQVEVAKSVLLPDGKTVFLVIPSMKPAEQMSIRYTLKFADDSAADGEIINTVHKLGKHLDDAIAQYEDSGTKVPENLKPGLQQSITQGGKTDHRVARLAAQYNSATDAVSDMIGDVKGAYTSKWTGYLDLQERKQVVFSFQGKGVVELKVDGKVILEENGNFGVKASESIQLDPGAHQLELNYTGAEDGSGHVRLLWEGGDFPVQSIPSSFFKHQENDALSTSMALRHGRDVMVQQNCTSCHSADEKLSLPELAYHGPDMKGIGSRVSEKWLATWLASPHSVKPGTTMPAIVDGSTEGGRKDAADMAAYLATLVGEKPAVVEAKAGDAKQGGGHFHKLGCVACHTLPDQDYDAKTGRIALNRISDKYSQSSLTAFLLKPDKNHASIKMPDFGMSDDEAREIAAFIRSESEGKAPASNEFSKGDAARGAKLVATNNCASCHSNLPNENGELPSFKSILGKSWADHGCVTVKTPGKAPLLNMSDGDRDALEAFRSHFAKDAVTTLSVASSVDFSERQVEALNCVACHQRDELPSLLASLHSQSQHLTEGIPTDAHHEVDQSRPSLTYIGEMLHSDYMEKMIDGKLETRPRPWLAMRMPAFHSRANLLTKGLAGQHGMAPSKVDTENLDAAKIKVGKQLIGSTGGFACVICHADGGAKALAAFEVEGVNFDQVARRLRTGYYHKWMENPQSITPTTKMPRYTTGNKSPFPVYEQDAEEQFESVMEYLKSLEKAKK
ncbi:MAG: c-type cytochrome [Akkermansiaceae bacterium]